VCALKQIFCNAYGAIIPVRLEHFSHLVGWFITLVYENGGANTYTQWMCKSSGNAQRNSGCLTAKHPIHSMGEISITLLLIFPYNLLVVRCVMVFPAFLFTKL
jgi:hypothetical protein